MKPLLAEPSVESPATPPAPQERAEPPVLPSGALSRRELMILGGAFALLLVAWSPKLSPTFYSTDDYYQIHSQDPGELITLTLGQGRFGIALLITAMKALGAPHAKTVTLYSWLALALFAFASVLLARIWRITHERWLPFLVGPLIFAHPYFAEVWTFRGVPFLFCVSLVPSLLALERTRTEGWRGLRIAVPLMVFALSVYQLAFNPLVATLLLGVALDVGRTGREKEALKRTLRSWLPALCMVPLSSITYMLVNVVIQKLLSVPRLERAALLPLADVPRRWVEVKQLYSHLLRDEVLSTPLLTGLGLGVLGAVTLLTALLAWRHRAPGKGLVMLLLSGASLACIAGLLVIVKVWGTSPRTLNALAFVIGGHLSLAYVLLSARLRGLVLLTASLLLVGFMGLSQQVTAGQLRVNEIDRTTAARVLQRLELLPGFQELRHIVFVNHTTWYPVALTVGDTNNSALGIPWGQVGLMSEISGRRFLEVTEARRAELAPRCEALPRWPDERSVWVEGDTAVICF
ncbi:MAG: glucosyltransferase domain-containing protein [Myxococcaceae bacterium]|nr:glucosyltransferase domain-containing protein [Myxococcaceae bacterium]